jgi:predicted RNase H-like HicB family nuclease
MTRAVHLPYTVQQDEDGVWCAHAQLRPGVAAHGEGNSREAAIADLREALNGLIAEFGVPDELTLTPDVEAWFAELDRFAEVPLFEDGRCQPPRPAGEDILG